MKNQAKVSEEELLGQLDTWLICCEKDALRVYGKHEKCPCKDVCKQAKEQIVALIKKSRVTEEFVEKWSNKKFEFTGTGLSFQLGKPTIIKMLKELGMEVIEK